MLPVLPDAETLVITHVRNHSGLTGLIGPNGKVGTFQDQHRPYVQVNRVGGTTLDGTEDHPRIQVSVWHTTDDAASTLARTIVATLPDIISDQVRGWELVLGPFPQPDEDNFRYIFDLEMWTYAGG